MTKRARDEGAVDHWKGGTVAPRSHNLERGRGAESRSEERLAEPGAPHQEPSGRELRRAEERERRKKG
ncbi:MAG TPA: hypothetical protein VHK28_05705 [Candidatus Limnocylindria bacterium]|nr:hypothetical protein [Candidatus Limnocylindria bacterium]